MILHNIPQRERLINLNEKVIDKYIDKITINEDKKIDIEFKDKKMLWYNKIREKRNNMDLKFDEVKRNMLDEFVENIYVTEEKKLKLNSNLKTNLKI